MLRDLKLFFVYFSSLCSHRLEFFRDLNLKELTGEDWEQPESDIWKSLSKWIDWGINFYDVEVGWSCMETASSFWAEVVNTRLARLSLTRKSLISLEINCKGCGSGDSKCMNGLCFNPSGYGVCHLCKRLICCYQWRRKNVLKLQLCFRESSEAWQGQYLAWNLLLSGSCCISFVFSLLLVCSLTAEWNPYVPKFFPYNEEEECLVQE